MGKIELDHTGSGGGITLSSDGTDLLLDGTAIGGGATSLNDLTDGVGNATTDNYGAGRDILGDITTGQENTAFGGLTGQQITTGSSNTFFGKNAGRFVTTGSYNVGIGLGAAAGTNLDKQTGDYNIGIGWNAGNAVVSTDKNTAVGYNADNTGNPNGSTAIGSDAVAAGDQATALTDSYASGTDSFAAAIANNTSSYGATGSSSVAIGKLAKATSTGAVGIGYETQSTGQYNSALGGYQTQATGTYHSLGLGSNARSTAFASTAINGGNTGSYATADWSVSMGGGALSNIIGKFAYSSAGAFGSGATGDAQQGTYVLRSDTTNATAEAMTTNNSTAGTTNQVVLPNNSVYGFTGTVIAREDSSSTDDFAVWEIKGGAVRGASASTAALGSYNINKISESTGAANWSIALSADTTNGAVAITVTGEAAHNIRWVATVNTTEVTY